MMSNTSDRCLEILFNEISFTERDDTVTVYIFIIFNTFFCNRDCVVHGCFYLTCLIRSQFYFTLLTI